jgi:tetratricopeptide (TPR) repeat protein
MSGAVLGQDDDAAQHYQQGSQLMDSGGDLDAAAEHFERAAELGFQPLGAAYRLSRIYARQGKTEKALQQLEILAAGGFGQINLLEGEADYDAIRGNERFVAAAATIRNARFPCSSDERHHAFDFWIGEWNVTQNGQFAGTNSVQPILGHCTIFEQWESASGGLGKSFNFYDPARDHWRQIWISDNGTFIEFTGEARDGGIFFTAQTTNPADGSVTDHKFEFTQLEGGIVRQSWETSTDGGASWTSVWDGRYERKAE